jgi:threonine synthase
VSSIAGLGEGNTPLVRSVYSERLWFKLESCNPSGSYKDRFVASEMPALLERGARACIATSSGNTGSALAAYCARYGLRCLILVNHDAPAGKLAQMQAHGAVVLRITNFAHDALVTRRVFEVLRAFSTRTNVPLVVSAFRYCPAGMSGVESIARELLAQRSGDRLDHVFVPVGGGGLFAAVVQGFQKSGRTMPKIHAVQPARCSTMAAAFLRGDYEIRPVTGSTRISGLAVPYDIDAGLALRLLRECGGQAFEVEDEEVFEAQQISLTREGIYTEPAGAAALAGWRKARANGAVDEAAVSVCLVTGHGFKDPASVEIAAQSHPSLALEADQLDFALPRLIEGTS